MAFFELVVSAHRLSTRAHNIVNDMFDTFANLRPDINPQLVDEWLLMLFGTGHRVDSEEWWQAAFNSSPEDEPVTPTNQPTLHLPATIPTPPAVPVATDGGASTGTSVGPSSWSPPDFSPEPPIA